MAGERGGLRYLGLSYYRENRSRLKLVAVTAGGGCISPSERAVQNVSYLPLSRPLFVYAKRASFERPEVRAFIGYLTNNARAIARQARFVPLTDRQFAKARQYRRAIRSSTEPRDRAARPRGSASDEAASILRA